MFERLGCAEAARAFLLPTWIGSSWRRRSCGPTNVPRRVGEDGCMSDADLTAFLHDTMPFCAALGMRLVENSPARVRVEMDWSAEKCTTAGLLHGGALMALADSAGGACAFANLPPGAAGTLTIESKTNFLGAVRDGVVTATSTPLHVGGSTIVIETAVTDASGRLVGKTTQTQTVLRPR